MPPIALRRHFFAMQSAALKMFERHALPAIDADLSPFDVCYTGATPPPACR